MTSSPIACLSLANNEVRLFEPTTKDLIICSRNHAGCQGERGAYYLYSNSGVLRGIAALYRALVASGNHRGHLMLETCLRLRMTLKRVSLYLVAARLCSVTDAPCSVAACRIAPRPGSYPAFPRGCAPPPAPAR